MKIDKKTIGKGSAIVITSTIVIVLSFLIINYLRRHQSIEIVSTAKINDLESVALIKDQNNKSRLEKIETESGNKIEKLIIPARDQEVVQFKLSPDKNFIAYSVINSNNNQNPIQSIWVSDINGEGNKLIAENISTQTQFALDFESKNLAYTTSNNLNIINIENLESKNLFEFDEITDIGTDVLFVPEPFWDEESKSVRIVIRDKDYPVTKEVVTYKISVDDGKTEELSRGEE